MLEHLAFFLVLTILGPCSTLTPGQDAKSAGARDKPDAEAVKQGWKKLEGTWTVTKVELEGKSLLEKDKPVPKFTIEDGKITYDGMDVGRDPKLDSSTIKLDPSQKPKTITIPNFDGGAPEAGITLLGIYELQGDELKVCAQEVETARLNEREKERPKAFDSKQGMLVVFRREKK
jgi:uncharacterized protein (TIGR03067 family)